MTVAGVRTPRTRGRPGGRSKGPVVVARITLAMPPPPSSPPGTPPEPLDQPAETLAPASRRDLHVARRQRRRDALLGLGVLAATLGATVAVLDMLH